MGRAWVYSAYHEVAWMSYYDWARLGHCFHFFDGSTSPSIHSSSRSSSNPTSWWSNSIYRSKGQSKGCSTEREGTYIGVMIGLIRNERDVGPHAFFSPAAGEDAGSEMGFQFGRDVIFTPVPVFPDAIIAFSTFSLCCCNPRWFICLVSIWNRNNGLWCVLCNEWE